MTKEEIIEMAKQCAENDGNCVNCKWCDHAGCDVDFAKYIVEKENEPAPAGTDTSSKKNYYQLNDNTKLEICQEAGYKKRFINCSNALCEVDVAIEKIATLIDDLINDYDFYKSPIECGAYTGAACMTKSHLTKEEKQGLAWIAEHSRILNLIRMISDYTYNIKSALSKSGEV